MLPPLVERLFTRFYRVEPLDPDNPELAMRIAFQHYVRAPFTLPDGTTVARGDLVCELHMRNDLLAELHTRYGDPSRVAAAYLRLMRDAMRRAASMWQPGGRLERVVALYGVSLFPGHLARGGFVTRPVLPRWRSWLVSWWSRKVVAGAHPEGRTRVLDANGKPLAVYEAWLSRQACLARYGPKPPTSADTDEL